MSYSYFLFYEVMALRSHYGKWQTNLLQGPLCALSFIMLYLSVLKKSLSHSLKELSELNTVRWDVLCISKGSMRRTKQLKTKSQHNLDAANHPVSSCLYIHAVICWFLMNIGLHFTLKFNISSVSNHMPIYSDRGIRFIHGLFQFPQDYMVNHDLESSSKVALPMII